MNNNETIADFEDRNILNIEKVIEKYNNYIYTVIEHSISTPEDIEEILSDVFIVLWKNYNKIDKNINIKAYLVGIAKNLIKKKYRNYNTTCEMESIEDFENKINSHIDIQELIEENEKSKIIESFIEKLKDEDKNIFIMFYYQSKKIKEISKILKISETKVKVTLHRLRKQAKKKIKEGGYSYGK